MKRIRIEKRNMAEKMIRAAETIDRQPWAMIAFTIVVAAFMIGGALIYNTVVPAYQ